MKATTTPNTAQPKLQIAKRIRPRQSVRSTTGADNASLKNDEFAGVDGSVIMVVD
jgi:hypothetical protein